MKAADGLEADALGDPEPAGDGEGFVLDEVEMKGFMRYVERTDPPLRFPEKFTVITGRTGAGKSTILDAITFALYGATTRTDIQSVRTSDVCRPGGYVRVGFRQGDHRWEVRRGFTARKESYLEVLRDGDAVPGTIHEKEQTIRDVVGLDYVGFRNSTFVRQEEMKDLGSARGADRLAVFQKLFRLEVFERALERAKEQFAELQAELRAREADIAARLEALGRLPGLRAQLDEAREAFGLRGKRVVALEAEVKHAEAMVKSLQTGHETWLRAASGRDELRKRLGGLDRRIREAREAGRAPADLEVQRKTLEAEVGTLDGLREEADALRTRAEDRRRREQAAQAGTKLFEQAKRDHERRRDGIKDKIDALYRKIASLRTDLDREAAFEFLRDEGRLEERLARIDRELTWLAGREDLVRELEGEKARAAKALEGVRGKVASIDADVFVLTEFRRQLEELKDELRREADESHRTLAPLDEEKVEALRALDAAPWSEADATRLETVARGLQEIPGKRKRLEEIIARLKGAAEAAAIVGNLESQREDLVRELAEKDQEVSQSEGRAKDYEAAQARLEVRRKELEEARRAFHTVEGQADALARQVRELEGDEERLHASEREREELRTRIGIADVLVNRVFHKRGVVMFAVDQILPALEIEASKNLAELTAGRFHRIKLETYEEGRGHGIRIHVQGVDGNWHDVGEFSGGEKTQINAALRFAIARELASLPQVGRTYGRMKTLFIDEGDLGSLDTEVSRELFVQKLFRMGESFEKVILITHLAEVAERFPGRIRVTMTPSQESRADVLA